MALKPKGLLVAAGLAVLTIGVSASSLLAQQAQPQAAKPNAAITIVAVPGNPADPNAITAILPSSGKPIAEWTSGLNNVSVGVPVTLNGGAADKATVTKYTWTLTPPPGSKAKLSTSDKATIKFTPDLVGMYKVDLVASNDAGSGNMASVQIHAGDYIGVSGGNCIQCHPTQTTEWKETGHAMLFEEQINGGPDPKVAEYGIENERCIACHTTGYDIGVNNGGFPDVQAQLRWKMPPNAEVQAAKDNWSAVPAALQNMANIGCEDCHGPAKDHVQNGTAMMAVSLDNGVCDQCHNGSAKHRKGAEIVFSKHSDVTADAWTEPVGPSRQACVRCHSGKGYISFLQNPTEMASWDNTMQNVTCSVCHDPHSSANTWQLRVVGKPVAAAGVTKDFGLSATCVECHNARTTAADAAKGGTPHYSTAGEMLSDTGGVTYNQTVPNSPHGIIVGAAPMKDPDPNAEIPMLFGGVAPGSCVACHMYPTITDAKDPNKWQVGEHSFNMVSPDGKLDYTAACQSCHPGIKSFDLQAKADYDGNGKVEGVQEEVAGLLKTVQGALKDSGVMPIAGHPYFDQSNKQYWSDSQKNAVYNYLFVRGPEGADGKASAIHNFKRSVALLQMSYKDLTGKDVPNATLIQ